MNKMKVVAHIQTAPKNRVEIDEFGTKRYFNEKGQLHRENGPAVEWVIGTKEWWTIGSKEWWVNGQLHREGAPAIVYGNGDKEWWVNGQRHRENGPAIVLVNGSKLWFLNGQKLTDS